MQAQLPFSGCCAGPEFLTENKCMPFDCFGCSYLFDVLGRSGLLMALTASFTFHSLLKTTPPSFHLRLKAQTFRRKCKTMSMSSPPKALRTLRYVLRKPGVLDQICANFLNDLKSFEIFFHIFPYQINPDLNHFKPTKSIQSIGMYWDILGLMGFIWH